MGVVIALNKLLVFCFFLECQASVSQSFCMSVPRTISFLYYLSKTINSTVCFHLVSEVSLADFGSQVRRYKLVKYRFKSEFPLPVFLLWSLLIPLDVEMSNCRQACEELIFSQRPGTSHQTVLQSVLGGTKLLAPWCICTHTRKHTHHIKGINDTWDLWNRWKWVIWIRLDYGARISEEDGKKERKKETGERRYGRERESDQKAARSEASTATPLTTGDTEWACFCLSSARFKDIHENVICFDSQSHPSSSVLQSPPPPRPPSYQSDWLLRK